MSMTEVTDALVGKFAKILYSTFIMVMMSVIGFAANSVRDEFHDVNQHLADQDRELEKHGAALGVVENTEKSLIDSLRDSNSSITSLAATIAEQSRVNAALKQRMDDNDEFLKEIRPLGIGGEQSGDHSPR